MILSSSKQATKILYATKGKNLDRIVEEIDAEEQLMKIINENTIWIREGEGKISFSKSIIIAL